MIDQAFPWVALWFAFVFSVVIAYTNHFDSRLAKGYIIKGNRSLYSVRMLPALTFLIPYFCFISFVTSQEAAFSFYIVRILMLTVCLSVLLPLLPLLRKFLCAESCAHLWTVLAVLFCVSGLSPRWAIPLPFSPPSKQIADALLWIWLTGFSLIMLLSIVSHLLFRHHLLKNAQPVLNESYLQAWQWQLKVINLSDKGIHLYISPNTQTPLSIGIFNTCVVLPQRTYTPEELALILHHELVHVSRGDSMTKFAMCLMAAFMWFNPLIWIALQIYAQDLELSCDETVIYGRPQGTRMEYARLLLRTAPKQQGFTSCLSASASTLRYRLKSVVGCRKRIVGSAIIGVLCFLILFGCLCTGVRYQAAPAEKLLFQSADLHQLEVMEIFSNLNGVEKTGICIDDQRLLNYLATLSLQETTERLDADSFTNHVGIDVRTPSYHYWLSFDDCYLRVVTVNRSLNRQTTTYYWMDSAPDWQFLLCCIV